MPPVNLDLDEIERTLRAHRAEMQGKIDGLAKAPERGSGISFGKRVGDGTIEAVSRLSEVGVGNSLVVAMERVDRALAKLDEGTYGVCDNCGRRSCPRVCRWRRRASSASSARAGRAHQQTNS